MPLKKLLNLLAEPISPIFQWADHELISRKLAFFKHHKSNKTSISLFEKSLMTSKNILNLNFVCVLNMITLYKEVIEHKTIGNEWRDPKSSPHCTPKQSGTNFLAINQSQKSFQRANTSSNTINLVPLSTLPTILYSIKNNRNL